MELSVHSMWEDQWSTCEIVQSIGKTPNIRHLICKIHTGVYNSIFPKHFMTCTRKSKLCMCTQGSGRNQKEVQCKRIIQIRLGQPLPQEGNEASFKASASCSRLPLLEETETAKRAGALWVIRSPGWASLWHIRSKESKEGRSLGRPQGGSKVEWDPPALGVCRGRSYIWCLPLLFSSLVKNHFCSIFH